MPATDVMIDAVDPALQDREEPFNGVGMCLAAHVLIAPMLDDYSERLNNARESCDVDQPMDQTARQKYREEFVCLRRCTDTDDDQCGKEFDERHTTLETEREAVARRADGGRPDRCGVLDAVKGFRRLKGHKAMPQLVAALRARDQRHGLAMEVNVASS